MIFEISPHCLHTHSSVENLKYPNFDLQTGHRRFMLIVTVSPFECCNNRVAFKQFDEKKVKETLCQNEDFIKINRKMC